MSDCDTNLPAYALRGSVRGASIFPLRDSIK
jgi:hypothetical protein